MLASKPLRSPLKYHGSKGQLAPWIISHFPQHIRYVEPYFGGGSVLLAKDPAGTGEFVNDAYEHLTAFWYTLRHRHQAEDLRRELAFTPLSQAVFQEALGILESTRMVPPITVAWAFFVVNRMSRQGLGKDYCTPTSRLRRDMNENVSAWLSSIDSLPEMIERLRRVEVWNCDALEMIRELDSPDTLFYLDPPYLHTTRQAKGAYKHEMTEEDHLRLLSLLKCVKGKFVLSGYESELYTDFANVNGWHTASKEVALSSSSKKTKAKKTEWLWMNFEPPTQEGTASDSQTT